MFPMTLRWHWNKNANLGSNAWCGFDVDCSPSNLDATLRGAKSQASADLIGR